MLNQCNTHILVVWMGDISHPSYHLPKTNQNLRNDVLFVKLEEVDQIIYIVICASGNQDSVQLPVLS